MLKKLPITVLLMGASCLLAIALYWPGLWGGYALDDFTNIVQNDALAIHELSWRELSRFAFSFQAGPTMRPLSMISFALNRYFFGADPFSFKVTNLAIHIGNGLLVFALLYQLLTAYGRLYATQVSTERLRWLGLGIAVLWLLHPLNFLPVLYVVQRETTLSALFVLLGVNLYLCMRRRQLSGQGRWWPIWTGIPLLTLLAVLCKESGALLPLYLLMIEIFIFRFHGQAGGFNRQLLAFYALLLLIPACLGLAWMLLAHNGAFVNYANRDFTMTQRLLSETRVIWSYIEWTLFPDPSALGLYHDDIPYSVDLLHPLTTLTSLVGLAGLMVLCLCLRQRQPLVALGIAWFLCGQLIESTVIPLELAYEHRNYLPDLGLLLAVFSLVFPLAETAALRLPRYTLLVIALAFYGAVTLQRASNWRDNLTFAETEAQHHPGSPYATYTLGQIYTNMALFGNKELYPEAVTALAAASALPDSGIIPDVSRVLLESQITGTVEPGALHAIANKLATRRISASDLQALNALVDCADKKNCLLSPADMQALFKDALANPNLDKLPSVHADLLVMDGNYVSAQGVSADAQARDLMAQAASLVPAEPQYRANLVTMDIAMHDAAQATRDLQALRALNYLGHLDAQIMEFEAEIEYLESKDSIPKAVH